MLHVGQQQAVVVLGQLKALDGQLVGFVTVLLAEEAEPQRDGSWRGGEGGGEGEGRGYSKNCFKM